MTFLKVSNFLSSPTRLATCRPTTPNTPSWETTDQHLSIGSWCPLVALISEAHVNTPHAALHLALQSYILISSLPTRPLSLPTARVSSRKFLLLERLLDMTTIQGTLMMFVSSPHIRNCHHTRMTLCVLVERNGYNVLPTATFANGTAIPNGQYKILIRALKIAGDATNLASYESWLSPPIEVAA